MSQVCRVDRGLGRARSSVPRADVPRAAPTGVFSGGGGGLEGVEISASDHRRLRDHAPPIFQARRGGVWAARWIGLEGVEISASVHRRLRDHAPPIFQARRGGVWAARWILTRKKGTACALDFAPEPHR